MKLVLNRIWFGAQVVGLIGGISIGAGLFILSGMYLIGGTGWHHLLGIPCGLIMLYFIGEIFQQNP